MKPSYCLLSGIKYIFISTVACHWPAKTRTLSSDSSLLRLRMMSNFLLQEVEGPNQRVDGELLLASLAATTKTLGTLE